MMIDAPVRYAIFMLHISIVSRMTYGIRQAMQCPVHLHVVQLSLPLCTASHAHQPQHSLMQHLCSGNHDMAPMRTCIQDNVCRVATGFDASLVSG